MSQQTAERATPRLSIEDRIRRLSQLDPETGCWSWLGYLNHNGYGRLNVGGKQLRAHRASYETFVGPIPDGLVIDHLCRNRACVNPEHLEPVTMQVNTERGIGGAIGRFQADKTECANGHEFSEANTYQRKSGGRDCRTCRDRRVEASRRRRFIAELLTELRDGGRADLADALELAVTR